MRLAAKELPKEHHKLAYKLSKIVRAAKTENDALSDSLIELMAKCGFKQGESNVPIEAIEEFNRQSKKFMTATTCDLWGDPIQYSEIAELVNLSPLDLAELDWLIVDDQA